MGQKWGVANAGNAANVELTITLEDALPKVSLQRKLTQ